MADKGQYIINIEGKPIEVTPEVYYAYYRMARQERGQEEKKQRNGVLYAALYVDESSTWTVTGDSRLTSLHCAGTIIDSNDNAVTVQGTDGTVYVQGSSPYTITVDTYNSDADCTGASTVEHWSDFVIAKP